ncbi:MAG: DUF2877 domain-containing protein [Roseiarcus sp.]
MRVHSVFHAALNLSSPDGDLLTLLSAEVDDLPHGVRLASVEDFSSLGLAAGDGGVFTVDEIVLERPLDRGKLRVDCAAARRLAAPPPPPLRGDDERWRAGVAHLEALQERAATDLRVAPLLTGAQPSGAMGERLTQAALDLGRGVWAGRLDAVRGAAARLVGLGQGLTPAGDDFLCGFFAAGCCRRAAGLARSHLLMSFAEVVRELLGQTTEISASFLRDALAGRISRPLAALAEACSGAPGSDLDHALLRLAAIGHSSGLDAATGFFYGANVWGARAPAEFLLNQNAASLRPRRVAGALAERQSGAADPAPSE